MAVSNGYGWGRELEKQALLGLGISIVSFFARYAVRELPPRVAYLGVIVGMLVMASAVVPSLSNSNLSFALFITGCLFITGSIVVDSAVSRSKPSVVRHLTDDQKSRLAREATKLKPIMPEIGIMQVNGDPEAQSYARDFADAFRRAGVAPRTGWVNLPDGADQVGVIIAVREPRSLPHAAGKVQEALSSIGVDATIQPFSKTGIGGDITPEVEFSIYVAPRPL